MPVLLTFRPFIRYLCDPSRENTPALRRITFKLINLPYGGSRVDIPKRKKREFLPEDFTLTDWNSVKPYFEDLKKREITDALDLKEWLADRSELEAYLSENFAWRYIRMTCDTADEKLTNDLNYFIEEIQPRVAPESDQLNQKALASPYLGELTEAGYDIMTRSLKKR
jgi:oligoendopeptidase F